VFCGALCDGKADCEAAKGIQKAFIHDISDGELNVFIDRFHQGRLSRDLSWIQLQVIKQHISLHRWLHKLPTYNEAVTDFLQKFGWVIEAMSRAKQECGASSSS
jgi:hypothetical protein